MAQRRRRSTSFPTDTINHALGLYDMGDSPTEIVRKLELEGVDPPPHVNTVKLWVRGRQRDGSGPWTIAEAALDTRPDAAVVLAELGAVITSSGGRVTGMTRDEARWVTFLTHAFPDIADSAGSTWELARRCIAALASERPEDINLIERALAEGASHSRWPEHAAKVAALREIGQRLAAARRAGKDPALNGRPYEPEDG